MEEGSLPPFVSAEWVAAHLDEVILADVRWSLDGSQGRRTYLERHLPGALFVDLERVLSDEPGPNTGRHPLPAPERFAAGLASLGIGHRDRVVAYDQGSGTIAARLVWMLRALGEEAAVLDGGLAAWGGPFESGEPRRPSASRTAVAWPAELLADADQVEGARRRPGARIVDARDADRFRGDVEPVDARPGHIPGAVNLPASSNADAEGRLLDDDELRRRYEAAGALGADEVIAYCGSGVTATHDLLVLELLGGVRGRLYPGSWSAWSADPARPAATGDGS